MSSLPCPPTPPGILATAGLGHVAAGQGFVCGVLDDATVKCFGTNFDGELGQGDTTSRGGSPGTMGDALPPVSLGTGRTAVQVAAHPQGYHTCTLLDDGNIRCFGDNGFGQLGLGDTATRGSSGNQLGDALPTVALGSGVAAAAVAVGAYHTCALLSDGGLKCFGYNYQGQLGLGVSTLFLGGSSSQLGDSLPAVSLGSGRTAVAVAAGDGHTCVLLDDFSVKCMGDNSKGQLGLGDTINRGLRPGDMGDALPAVSLGSGRTVLAVSAGSLHTCFILDDFSLKCVGDNTWGQLGLGDSVNHGVSPQQMGDGLPAVSLGTGTVVSSVSCGYRHTCVLLVGGKVKCFGANSNGQLGLGDTIARGTLPQHMADALPSVSLGTGRTVTMVLAGDDETCVLMDTGGLRCFGANSGATVGQLGYGDTLDRGSSANQLGDTLPSVDLGTGRTVALAPFTIGESN